MAVPKRKTSKERKHTRAANWKAQAPTLVECKECHELKVPHRVCAACGSYDGQQIIAVSDEKKK